MSFFAIKQNENNTMKKLPMKKVIFSPKKSTTKGAKNKDEIANIMYNIL